MLLQCNNCGAPLDARAAKQSIKCNYCGAVHVKEALPVQHAQVPTGWKPPEVWVAPAHFAAAGQSLQYKKTAAAIQTAVILGAIIPLIVGIGTTAAVTAHHATSSMWHPSSPFGGAATHWDGSTLFRCGGADQVTLVGISTTGELPTAIDVEDSCRLTVTGGTLRVSEHGVAVGVNGKVELHGVHIVLNAHKSGEASAVLATVNGEADLYDCTIEVEHGGKEAAAAEARDNGHIRFHGGRATGHYTLKATGNGVVNALGNAELRGRVEERENGHVSGAHREGGEGRCDCAKGDHACHHRCKKER